MKLAYSLILSFWLASYLGLIIDLISCATVILRNLKLRNE